MGLALSLILRLETRTSVDPILGYRQGRSLDIGRPRYILVNRSGKRSG